MATNYHQAKGHCLNQRWPVSLGLIQLTWNGLEISSSNSIAEKRYEYWQYLKKYNTDIIINKIQKEKRNSIGLIGSKSGTADNKS